MIIAVSDVETENAVHFQDMGIRSWRWVLSIGWFYLSLDRELSCNRSGVVSEWRPCCEYFQLYFRPFYWKTGYSSTYYNGNHQWFFFGPFSITWVD